MKTILRISLLVVLGMLLIGTTLATSASANFASANFAASAAPEPFSQSGSTASDYTAVDAYVTETLHRLPIKGLALAIVRGDQVLYMKGYGVANIQGDPVTPQTPFMLGSVTKSFTALAVQQLIIAGKIEASKPVQSYLPAFRLADDRAGAGVTIRHLLDHTSGISTQEGVAPYLNNPKTTFPEALDQLARFRPQYTPGAHEEYSNWNYNLLAQVIAQTSGQTYAGYVQQHILDPLDMSHTGVGDYHTLPHAATYDLNVFGFPVPYDEKYLPNTVGAGRLNASAEDMSHYLIALLNRGQYQDHSLLPVQRSGWYNAYWNWQSSDGEGVRIAMSGSYNCSNAHIQFIPQDRLGVVVLMNTRLDEIIPTAPNTYEIATNITNIMLDEPHALPDFNGYYQVVALIDGLLILLIASAAWQALRLKNWKRQYQAAKPVQRSLAWLGILLNLLVCGGIVVLPLAFDVNWASVLSFRPDFAIPVLVVGVCLGALGLIKAASVIGKGRRSRQTEQSPIPNL